jgi:hypothetical protein
MACRVVPLEHSEAFTLGGECHHSRSGWARCRASGKACTGTNRVTVWRGVFGRARTTFASGKNLPFRVKRPLALDGALRFALSG